VKADCIAVVGFSIFRACPVEHAKGLEGHMGQEKLRSENFTSNPVAAAGNKTIILEEVFDE
jgi:hypothetical protein